MKKQKNRMKRKTRKTPSKTRRTKVVAAPIAGEPSLKYYILGREDSDPPFIAIFDAKSWDSRTSGQDSTRCIAVISPPPAAREVAPQVIAKLPAKYGNCSITAVADKEMESGPGFLMLEGVPEDEIIAAAKRAFPGGVETV